MTINKVLYTYAVLYLYSVCYYYSIIIYLKFFTGLIEAAGGLKVEHKEYSAGMVKLSFWFMEFRKVVNLLNSGKTIQEIKKLNEEENIFGAPTSARAKQMLTTVTSRVNTLDKSLLELFELSDISTQKIINLIAIMNVDQLFFEFIYEVYREKILIGEHTITDLDLAVFFKNKQIQDDRVASWKDYTLKRLGTCYKTLLMEAGLINNEGKERKILIPILDIALENYLKDTGQDIYIKALTGVR